MDEARYIDWYDVVQAVANGRTEGHLCPACETGRLQGSSDGRMVRIRCASCGEGFEGRLAAGRDDGLYAEAAALSEAMNRRGRKGPIIEQVATRAAVIAGGVCAPGPDAEARALTGDPSTGPAEAVEQRNDEAWQWSLPSGSDDVQGLADWMDVVESIHNGRRMNLRCPYCSEPLDHIEHRPPFIRVRCAVCGEGFEGRLA